MWQENRETEQDDYFEVDYSQIKIGYISSFIWGLLSGYLSIWASILTMLHGAHRGSVWPQPQV